MWQSVECDSEEHAAGTNNGKRAKGLCLRQNILDKYGRTGRMPRLCWNWAEECRARIEQETVDKSDAIKLETSGNQKEILQEPDVSLNRKIGEPDVNPGEASSLTADTPNRGKSEQGSIAENENKVHCGGQQTPV